MVVSDGTIRENSTPEKQIQVIHPLRTPSLLVVVLVTETAHFMGTTQRETLVDMSTYEVVEDFFVLPKNPQGPSSGRARWKNL